MATMIITTTTDGWIATSDHRPHGVVFRTKDPRDLGRTIEEWATAQSGHAAAMFAAGAAALPPPGRSHLNSRADQEGIATPSRWPAAALRHWPGDAA